MTECQKTNMSIAPSSCYQEELQSCTTPNKYVSQSCYAPANDESKSIGITSRLLLPTTLLSTPPNSARFTRIPPGAGAGIVSTLLLVVGAMVFINDVVNKMHTKYNVVIANNGNRLEETPGTYIHPPLTVKKSIECYCSFNHGTRLTECNMDRCKKSLGKYLDEMDRKDYKCESKSESYDYKFGFPPKEKYAPTSTRFKRYIIKCKR